VNPFKCLRDKTKHTQESASEILGVERSTIAKWETGAAMPTAKMLPKIASLYGCSVDDLLYDKELYEGSETAAQG